MKSRYDYMIESGEADLNGELWPDPMSIKFTEQNFTSVPSITRVSTADIEKFWLAFYKVYGKTELDDILLTVNGLPYLGLLSAGSPIVWPSYTDLKNSPSGYNG